MKHHLVLSIAVLLALCSCGTGSTDLIVHSQSGEEPSDDFTLKVNDRHHAFHLFASHIETEKPDPNDPGVYYFGPGIHEAGTISLKSNETVYIEARAIVHGNIEATGVKNIKIAGHGILDASKIGRFDTIRGKIENITFRNITYNGTHFPITTMEGLSRAHSVSHINFENVILNDEKVKDQQGLRLQANEFVSDIKVN